MIHIRKTARVDLLIQVILYILQFIELDLSLIGRKNPDMTTLSEQPKQRQHPSLVSHERDSEPTLLQQIKPQSSISIDLPQTGRCIRSAISGQPRDALQLESPDCYTIGLITALSIELAAVEAMLDEEHLQPDLFERSKADTTVYTWGRIGDHNVVIAAPKKGVIGKVNAASVAGGLISSITSIRMGLLIGIGGGIPRPGLDPDIRLGDVVVSAPEGTSGGVIEYDLGKEHILGFERRGFLNRPPDILLSAVTKLEAKYERGRKNISEIFDEALERNPAMAQAYRFPGLEMDVLFPATYNHVGSPNCVECNQKMRVSRPARGSTTLEVHFGVVATGDKVIKNARKRDETVLALEKEGIKAFTFEMEAAGRALHCQNVLPSKTKPSYKTDLRRRLIL